MLTNGTVLLAGGVDDPGPHAYAEVYDSFARTFSVTGEMTKPRDGHKSVLLPDGMVLVTGGEASLGFPWEALAAAEVFDPASGRFSRTGNMRTANFGATWEVLGGIASFSDSSVPQLGDLPNLVPGRVAAEESWGAGGALRADQWGALTRYLGSRMAP